MVCYEEKASKADTVVFINGDIELDDAEFDIVTFFSDDMVLVTINLNNINLNGSNAEESDPTIIVFNKSYGSM